jgi:hypothetical protein
LQISVDFSYSFDYLLLLILPIETDHEMG